MNKAIVFSAAALTLVAAIQPDDAEAKKGRNTAAVAGAVGGLAVGALIGGALANPQPAPSYGYAPAPSYGYAPAYPSYAPARVCETRLVRRPDAWGRLVTFQEQYCY
jgi:hypothetical protein